MAPVVNGYNRGILNRRVVRAAVIEEFGRDLRIEDVEMEAGPGEVPVEVRASGICGRDLVVWRGDSGTSRPPLIPGHEVFGELDGRPVGEKVTTGSKFAVSLIGPFMVMDGY
jgi:D-arabinose 1-dehydrogenase-like Zn-dependent alcohol dehydrogenase